MANEDTGWRPEEGMSTYRGYEVWEHKTGPHHVNPGEVDGEVRIEDADVDAEEEIQ